MSLINNDIKIIADLFKVTKEEIIEKLSDKAEKENILELKDLVVGIRTGLLVQAKRLEPTDGTPSLAARTKKAGSTASCPE